MLLMQSQTRLASWPDCQMGSSRLLNHIHCLIKAGGFLSIIVGTLSSILSLQPTASPLWKDNDCPARMLNLTPV